MMRSVRGGQFRVMGDHEDGHAASVKLLKGLDDLVAGRRIQVTGRLVR